MGMYCASRGPLPGIERQSVRFGNTKIADSPTSEGAFAAISDSPTSEGSREREGEKMKMKMRRAQAAVEGG